MISETHKQFMLDVISKVKYKDFQFRFDSICYPTDEQVADLKRGKITYRLSITILHYGEDTDPGKGGNMSWLTYFGHVMINEWSEKAIQKAIFITLMQKLRHETSEEFQCGDEFPFHEHRTELVEIPK